MGERTPRQKEEMRRERGGGGIGNVQMEHSIHNQFLHSFNCIIELSFRIVFPYFIFTHLDRDELYGSDGTE